MGPPPSNSRNNHGLGHGRMTPPNSNGGRVGGGPMSNGGGNAAIVTINMYNHDASTPLGLLLAPSFSPSQQQQQQNQQRPVSSDEAYQTIVAGWERLPTKKFGPVQRSGQVRIGDRLVGVNNVDVSRMKFRSVMNLLKSAMKNNGGGGLKSLSFAPPLDFVGRGKHTSTNAMMDGTGGGGPTGEMDDGGPSSRQQQPPPKRYDFQSCIRRARVKEEQQEPPALIQHQLPLPGTNKAPPVRKTTPPTTGPGSSAGNNTNNVISYVEYEIYCCLIIRGRVRMNSVVADPSSSQATAVRIGKDGEEEHRWSVWRRFSDFQVLDQSLRLSYGWQFDSIVNATFPSSKPISSFFSKLSPDFVERRRDELQAYWQKVLQIEEMTDFSQPHRYSRDLSRFLELDRFLRDVLPIPSPVRNNRDHPSSSGSGGGRMVVGATTLEARTGGVVWDDYNDSDGREMAWGDDRRDTLGRKSDGIGRGEEEEDGSRLLRWQSGPSRDAVVRDGRRRGSQGMIAAKSEFQRRVPGTVVGIMVSPP